MSATPEVDDGSDDDGGDDERGSDRHRSDDESRFELVQLLVVVVVAVMTVFCVMMWSIASSASQRLGRRLLVVQCIQRRC